MADLRNPIVKVVCVIIVAVILIAAVVALMSYSNQPKEQPSLQVSLQTLSGKTGDSPTLNFRVTNDGGDATGVIVSISSSAFSQGSTNKIDISAGHNADVSCKVKVNDVASNDYPVTITYTYDGGSTATANSSSTFHVVPKLEIVNQHWDWPFLAPQEKSHVGPNDSTTLYFKVKSDTTLTCNDLSIQAAAQPGTIGLAITPNTMDIDPIGPTGTSKEYSLGFKTTNMPPGTYTITIKAFSGADEAATLDVTLWVNG